MALQKFVKKEAKIDEAKDQDLGVTPQVKALIGKLMKKHRKSLEILAKH
jgi:hypothetical protein